MVNRSVVLLLLSGALSGTVGLVEKFLLYCRSTMGVNFLLSSPIFFCTPLSRAYLSTRRLQRVLLLPNLLNNLCDVSYCSPASVFPESLGSARASFLLSTFLSSEVLIIRCDEMLEGAMTIRRCLYRHGRRLWMVWSESKMVYKSEGRVET